MREGCWWLVGSRSVSERHRKRGGGMSGVVNIMQLMQWMFFSPSFFYLGGGESRRAR